MPRLSARARIVFASVVLWVLVASGAIALAGPQRWSEAAAWPWWVGFMALAASFALAEVFVVHLHLRGNAHTFSMAELPLALGLFYTHPLALIAANVVGGGLALALYRRQSPLKLAFNSAVLAASAVVAVGVFRFLSPDPGDVDTALLLSGALALTIANVVSLGLILGVIVLASGKRKVEGLLSGVQFSILSNWFTVSLAVIAVTMIDAQPALSWLVVVPVAGTYLANWAYTTERRRHEVLDFLYQSSRILQQSPELELAILDLLRRAQTTFNVRTAELAYWTEAGAMLSLGVGDDGEPLTNDQMSDHDQLSLLANELGGARKVRSTDDCPGAAFVAGRNCEIAIIAPLFEDSKVVGALVIADPLSKIRTLDENDLRLADTLASHAAVALENGQLEQSLDQLRLLERRLSFQATHDPLTDLANRTLFRERLATLLADHHGTRGAVLFIDLDDFKTVNDTLGHGAGDELLLEVAKRLEAACRADDTVARLGGDEFAILLPDVTAESAALIAGKILTSLDTPAQIAGRAIEVRASIGVAGCTPDSDAEALMRNADTAMYQAKAGGKHRHVTFHSSMYESSLRRYNLQTDLRNALERHELSAYFQPILAIDTQQLVGVEALVRWDHPTLGLLTPDNFLPVAMETGLIEALDLSVLDQACAWLAATDLAHPNAVPSINVNLSPQSFRQEALTSMILDTLARHRVSPSRLVIEVTEDLLADDVDNAAETLDLLRRKGMRVALDDFGTGYSSLSYLRTLPIDTIKIPKSFIDDLDTSDHRADAAASRNVFVAAIITLSRALDATVVAEGIERIDQRRVLEQLGCPQGQGYLFARPMDAQGFESWLDSRRSPTSG